MNLNEEEYLEHENFHEDEEHHKFMDSIKESIEE